MASVTVGNSPSVVFSNTRFVASDYETSVVSVDAGQRWYLRFDYSVKPGEYTSVRLLQESLSGAFGSPDMMLAWTAEDGWQDITGTDITESGLLAIPTLGVPASLTYTNGGDSPITGRICLSGIAGTVGPATITLTDTWDGVYTPGGG